MTPPSDLPAATKLAVDRTRLAYERTLMAWIRTSASLISFGFTIYKFFQYLHDSSKDAPPVRALGPREFALTMIAVGVITLVLASIQHRQSLRVLRAEYGAVPYSLATVVALIVGALGVVGFVAVMYRI